jgi:multiple sugar transport system permease protein
VALVGLAAIFVAPIAFMAASSLEPEERVLSDAGSWRAFWPDEPTLRNYRDVFRRVPYLSYLASSAIVTGGTVIFGLLLNSMAGYALARLRFRGRGALLGMVLALLVVPFEAIAVPLFFMTTSLGWRDDYLVQIVPFAANALSIYLFYTFFLDLPPDLEDAARIDGAGLLRTFFQIAAPNAKPAYAAVGLLTFLLHWSLYLWPLLATTSEDVRPLVLGVATFYGLPPLRWGDIFAFGVLMVLPAIVLFVLLQRLLVRGLTQSGLGR